MIAIYIRDGVPIGSESLKLSIDMKISSATIRNYFKVLVNEGVLAQPHISSGKIPTNSTLKSYWKKNIDIYDCLNINSIDKIDKAIGKLEIQEKKLVDLYLESNINVEAINKKNEKIKKDIYIISKLNS